MAPFRHPAFAVIWTATLVSNVGGWMYSAASGWLMTSLNPDPLIVALVQAASRLPIFLFAIPAGALADIFDKRKFLIIVEIADDRGLGGLCGDGRFRPGDARQFAAVHVSDRRRRRVDGAGLAGGGAATRSQGRSAAAIAANSAGVNISRAIGPALGGVTISAYGIVAPFWVNAVANLGDRRFVAVVAAAQAGATRLPAERFGQAILAGLRYARHNEHLRATMMRAAGFFFFTSAYWALLPLVGREQIASGPGFTACCSASSAPAPWAAHFCCRG